MVTTYNEYGHALIILGERYSALVFGIITPGVAYSRLLVPNDLTAYKNLILLTSFNIVSLEQEGRYFDPFRPIHHRL